jgi:hypothetical protein
MQAGTHADPMGVAVRGPSVRIAAKSPAATVRVRATGRLPSLPTWALVALIIVCAVVASALIPN